MHQLKTGELFQYSKNEKQARLVAMSLREFYEQGVTPPTTASQHPHVPFEAMDFIQLDPFYGPQHHPNFRELKMIRHLVDCLAKVGTVVLIWNQYLQLADYHKMFSADFSKSAKLQWVVDPSPLVVVRSALRNAKSSLGPLTKRQTETGLLAVCVDGTKKKRRGAYGSGAELALLDTGHHDARLKLSDDSNVIMDYEPPTASELLKGEDGQAIRKMAEKGAGLNTRILHRFVPPGGKVADLMSGSASLGAAVILRGDSTSYLGIDQDRVVVELAKARLGRMWQLIARHQMENYRTLQELVTIQSVASSPMSLIMPTHNVPLVLENGNAPTLSLTENLDHPPALPYSPFEVKPTDKKGTLGMSMGDGFFLREDADPIAANTFLTSVNFYGTFVLTSQLDTLYPEGTPQPGVFALRGCDYSLIVSDACPAGKINDCRGTHQRFVYTTHMRPNQ